MRRTPAWNHQKLWLQLEQWVMVPRCVRLECLFFALDKQSNPGCVPFSGLFFFFLSCNHSIFFGLCWCVSVPLYIVYLFRVLSYLSGAVKLRMVWSEQRGQTCNIWLGKELKYSVDGSVAFIWASCCFANFRHVRELGSSSYNRSYTCAIITHQRHSNWNSKTLWCGVHYYYYYYFPFTVSAHQVWIWLLGEDECFLLKYNPTSLSIFFPSTWCK